METYMGVVIGFFAVDVILKLIVLGGGMNVQRTPFGMAIDCILEGGLIVWGVAVLVAL